jgi:hypothetical protein
MLTGKVRLSPSPPTDCSVQEAEILPSDANVVGCHMRSLRTPRLELRGVSENPIPQIAFDVARTLQPRVHLSPHAANKSPKNCGLWYTVKQLTAGYCFISVWQRSGFIWPFAPGEQKKLKGLTLHQRVQGSSPRGLTTPQLGVGHNPAPIFCASHQLVGRGRAKS